MNRNPIEIAKNIIDFSNHHHQFHYQESDEFFYIGCCYLKLHSIQNAKKSFQESLKHFSANKKTLQAVQDTQNNSLNYKEFLFSHNLNEDIYYYQFRNELYHNRFKIAQKLYSIGDFVNLLEHYQQTNRITKKQHFQYHVNLANLYYRCSIEYYRNNMMSESRYFLEKALETDKNNPFNKMYNNFLSQI